jgi:hypothetical protein
MRNNNSGDNFLLSQNLKNFKICKHRFITDDSLDGLPFEEKLVNYISSLRQPRTTDTQEPADIQEKIKKIIEQNNSENFEKNKKLILSNKIDKTILENSYKQKLHEIGILNLPEYKIYKTKIDRYRGLLKFCYYTLFMLSIGILFQTLDHKKFYYRNMGDLISDKKTFTKNSQNKNFFLLTVPCLLGIMYYKHRVGGLIHEFDELIKNKYITDLNLDDEIRNKNIKIF